MTYANAALNPVAMRASIAPLSSVDVGNRGGVDSKPAGNDVLPNSCAQKFFDFPNLSNVNPRPVVIVAQWFASLALFVLVVVVARSHAQMSRIHAGRVVARVHDDKPVRDRAMNSFKRISVGANRLFSRHQKNTVAVTVSGAIPIPAPVCSLVPRVEHVFGSEHWKFMQPPTLVKPHIVPPAKLSANSRTLAKQTLDRASALISHALFYRVNSGVCNVV